MIFSKLNLRPVFRKVIPHCEKVQNKPGSTDKMCMTFSNATVGNNPEDISTYYSRSCMVTPTVSPACLPIFARISLRIPMM